MVFERAKKRRTRWSVVASTRCACLFEIDKKKFQLPPQRERGDHRSFLPSNPSHSRIETEKKNEHFRKRPSNARARRPRDARERRIVASVVVVFKAAKVVVVSPWKPPCSKVVSRCVFLKWRYARFVFFFFAKAQRRETETERQRERETRGGKDATQTSSSSPFFLSNFETLKSNTLVGNFLFERERERERKRRDTS